MEIPAELNLRQDVPLGDFTTWKVGGAADFFAEPESSEQLEALVHWGRREQLPLRFIGAGSNLLISDEGLPAGGSAAAGCRDRSWKPAQDSSKPKPVNRCQRWPGGLQRPA